MTSRDHLINASPAYGYDGSSTDPDTAETDEEDSYDELKPRRACCQPPTAACCCHCFYVCQFLLFMIVFPLWTKWLVTNPMPTQYWHEKYPTWPSIAAVGGQDLAVNSPVGFPIEMSPIPKESDSCNFSCSSWRGYRTNEMNFRVSLTINDSVLSQGYVHTIYPVLLASSDFNDWWVVADRRFAYPSPFWRATTDKTGHAYSYTTDTCISPPEGTTVTREANSGVYVLACVVWSPSSFAELEAKTTVEDADLGTYCYTAGGVCGWTCDSVVNSDLLEGCTADSTIKMTSTSVAGREIPDANFQGSVQMRECLDGSHTGKCETATEKFKQWTCHKCLYDPRTEDDMRRRLQIIPGIGGLPSGLPGFADPEDSTGGGGLPGIAGIGGTSTDSAAKTPTIYTSLPRFHVSVSGASIPPGTDVFSQPRVFILQSSRDERGVWKKLYKHDYGLTEPPVAVDADGKPLVKKDTSEYDEELAPVQDPVSKHAMSLNQQNRLEVEPGWCYGRQGPLYLVACAVNSTLYEGGFTRFEAGQQAAPPPFNDRCVAVSGRCAHACQPDQTPMANCTAGGYIKQDSLVGYVGYEKNQTAPVWLFCYVLIIGFGVKAVMLCPGVFSPYPHYRRYHPKLTEQLRYIVVTIPSAGENKCTVLRNIVGAIGCMPKGCACRYHVAFVDEGHRAEQKVMFMKLAAAIEKIPNFGGDSYEENVMRFFQQWVEDTKKMDLKKVKDGYDGEVDPKDMEKMSGKNALKVLRRDGGWGTMPAHVFEGLADALTLLEEDLKVRKKETKDLHRDDVADWEPADRNSLALRLHYLARAKPMEDERTIKAQHVAPGTWYYRVPSNPENKDWLKLRANARQMVYGLEDTDQSMNNVPLRTSRGKAGGLNFAENYLSLYADRPENFYNDGRDDGPCLYSICDARHQFQTDFFHSTIPYFFTEDMQLNEDVGFTQCPQYFHEMQDEVDYLDNNNAQFFRLNCMIRNCCGGVSSCGTNGTWMIRHAVDDEGRSELVWEKEKRRVRDAESKRKVLELVERRTFHESCKVEDTASSLQQVLRGNRSQFINRRLSYGMAKNPIDYLAAVQRWAEGGVVLSLQTFFSCHKGVYMVWFTLCFFFAFLASLFRLVSKTDTTWAVVQWGLIDEDVYQKSMQPMVEWFRSWALVAKSDYFKQHPDLLETYLTMTLQFSIWVLSLVLFLVLVFLFTELLKFIQRRCVELPFIWPDEMRWWARLLISMDNLTYFLWFWTAFFWIGFNYYSIFAKRTYHFEKNGMFGFMLTVQILSWGMVIASSLRYTLSTSMEANEVIGLSMDNIWRSTQLFYMSAPLLLYSIIKGTQDYIRYQLYGEDISFWVGGDRGVMSTNLVKYWTLLLILGAVGVWCYYIIEGRKHTGVLSAVIIVTLIALDVLHPCTYLWVGRTTMTKEKSAKLTWSQALVTRGWWELMIGNLILNETVTGIMKWLGPAWFVCMPLLTLVMPYIGVNQAFMMIGGANR
mmetsp:Transcript_37158/g.85865  ORF Transcript_37158/g.85865 Transcript_37158/m.85865 type:complete len:1482 (+) Transcript_37158:59-4504(+)